MTRTVLPFPNARVAVAPRADAGLAWSTQSLLNRLAECLPPAIRFRNAVLKQDRTRGEPDLFFYHAPTPLRKTDFASTAAAIAVARNQPDLAAAWAALNDLADDAFTLLAAHVELRHLARTHTDLQASLASLGCHHAKCKALADLMTVTDDEVIRVLFPRQRAGFRVNVRGVVDVAQFHILLADAIHGDPRQGYLVGPRPDPRLVQACRFQAVDAERSTATAVFQFFHPEAFANGVLPRGLEDNRHWIWGHESLQRLPRNGRDRVVFADRAFYPRQWSVCRKFAAVEGDLELIEVLSESFVIGELHLPDAVVAAAA